ncbi:MAG: FkbM family methyltransferase [Nocardioides sp.]
MTGFAMRPGRRRRRATEGSPEHTPERDPLTLVRGRRRARTKLQAIARLRGQSEAETLEQVTLNLLRTAPKSMDGYDIDFNDIEVAEAGFEAGNPWMRMANGRIFYDYPATAKDALMYVLLRDRIPDTLNVETTVVAANAIRRYVNGTTNVPPDARVVVDAGCYIGYKPIAYADHVGPDGKVVAVEMMPDNYDLLRRNVEANGLDDRISTVNCGLSDRTGTMTARRYRKQQATIADNLDQLQGFGADCEVPVDTLANVFDRTLGARDVDFLNVQVNGNELDVLAGLGPWTHRVRSFSVTSPYTREGRRIRDEVEAWFRTHDIPVTKVGETSVAAERG